MHCHVQADGLSLPDTLSTGSRSRRGAGRHTTVTVKRPPPHTSNSNHLRNHANRARKSWRSDVPIILPGWERHTGGSRSIPTVHPCGPEAVGSSNHKHIKSPNVKPYGTVKSRKFAQKKKISKKSFWSEQYALTQTTLKITVVSSCTYPSMHFHCACRFNTPKTCTHVRHLGPCFKTGRTRPRCQERTSRTEQQLWSVNSKTWHLNAVHMSILRCVNAHRK